jgi:hypothetical protein
MIHVGDRVYHRGINGNGICVTIDESKSQDKYGIKFFWLKYKGDRTFHNLNGFLSTNNGLWCSEEYLIRTPHPLQDGAEHHNLVSMIGTRSLDKLIRKICEIPYRRRGDGSEIVINYGASAHAVPERIHVINRRLMMNKYRQIQVMADADVPVPETTMDRNRIRSDSEWIVKPFHSFGGRNIHYLNHYRDWDQSTHYAQRIVNKTREFRAHVFAWLPYENSVPLIQEKAVDDKSQLCWNKHQGGVFRYPYMPLIGNYNLGEELTARIHSIAFSACMAIGYDFGGVELSGSCITYDKQRRFVCMDMDKVECV